LFQFLGDEDVCRFLLLFLLSFIVFWGVRGLIFYVGEFDEHVAVEHVHVCLVVGFDVFQVIVRIIAEIRRKAFVENSGDAEIDSHEFYDGLTTASYRWEGFNDFAPLVNSSFGDYLDELCLIRNGQIAWVFGLELVFFCEIVFKLIPYFLRDCFFFKS